MTFIAFLFYAAFFPEIQELPFVKKYSFMKNMKPSRRDFIKKAAGTAFGAVALPSALSASSRYVELKAPERPTTKFAANDQINVGVIGMGIMGFNDASTSSQIPGVKIVAA